MIYFGLAIVYCLHGDEILGETISKNLEEKFPNILYVEGNPEAIKQNKRYVEKDLNRVFPGRSKGCYEEKRACSLLKKLRDKSIILDIHETNTISEPFIIITKTNEEIRRVVNSIPIKKVVMMSKDIAQGKSLIGNLNCGVSLEFPQNTSEDYALQIMECTLTNLLNGKKSRDKEFFYVHSKIDKPKDMDFLNIENFSHVKKGEAIAKSENVKMVAGDDFYPVFYGKKSFQNYLCLCADFIGDFNERLQI